MRPSLIAQAQRVRTNRQRHAPLSPARYITGKFRGTSPRNVNDHLDPKYIGRIVFATLFVVIYTQVAMG